MIHRKSLKTGFLYDDRFVAHLTGPCHPECPERLTAIYQGIESAGLLGKVTRITAEPPDMKWIQMVHPPAYIERFQKACQEGQNEFDSGDNRMCPATFEVACLAVGGILKTIDLLMTGQIDNAFCAIRPPGHHAEPEEAMGFCYFGNVAIAARYLQKRYGIKRVGIVDFDVHHGNGTQRIFEDDPTVFYYSIHQHPSFSYPGSGREFEKGVGKGTQYTLNSPALPGQGDEEYKILIHRDLAPAFAWFRPEVIITSTGFDAHREDMLADSRLSTEGFTWLMQTITAMAREYSGGRLLSVLEGGYCLKRLPELAANHVQTLLNA